MNKTFLIIFSLIGNILFAQNKEIKGVVLDIETNEKIAFVSIYQKNKNGEEKFGIMSNEKGEFILTVQNETIEVIFSHINYKTEKIKIEDLIKKPLAKLVVNNVRLDEVKITNTSPKTILKNAVENSSRKADKNILLNSYSREITKINDQYENISDAMIDFYVNKKNGSSKLVVNQSRAFVKDTVKLKKSLSVFDVRKFVKNAYDFNLIKKIANSKNYEFQIQDQSNDNDKEFQNIKIIPKKEIQEMLYEGYAIIDTKNNTIAEIKLQSSKYHKEFAKYANVILFEMRINNTIEWSKFRTIDDKYILVYNKDGLEISFKMKDETAKDYVLNATCDIFIQDFRENVTVPQETYNKKSIFQSGTKYTEEYWKQIKSYPFTEEEQNFIQSFN
ncbi:carboxypeptidase-like regulatory domain-containing protein [Flavobacterium sp. TBRC 19031]|uniref:carboxypeptidase-like regulatory domain-containing protein n=1 Tax=Flavobacterium mekongense TaxID=3379707 RepID=UPI00399A8C2B